MLLAWNQFRSNRLPCRIVHHRSQPQQKRKQQQNPGSDATRQREDAELLQEDLGVPVGEAADRLRCHDRPGGPGRPGERKIMGQFILGRKGRMTQVYTDDGRCIPVTILEAGPCTVTQVKTVTSDGYNAVQLGFNDQKDHRVTKALLGHIKKHNGKAVKRPYTPSSLPGTTGYFDLTVKRYDTGSVSKYLHEQKIGDTVLMSGPNTGGHWVDGMAKHVGFVAGGTGITPMISIIRWILTNKLDAELFLIFANKTESDIIFRQEWERALQNYPNFHSHHVLEQPPPGWSGSIGRITSDILRRHLPPPASDTCIFLCGPPPMVDSLEVSLKELGYPEQAIVLP